jgi:hypothetical protein
MYLVSYCCFMITIICLCQGWEGVPGAIFFAGAGVSITVMRGRLDKAGVDDLRRQVKEGLVRNPSALLDIDIGDRHLTITKATIMWRGEAIRISEVSGVGVINIHRTINLVDSSTRSITLTGSFGERSIDCVRQVGVDIRSRMLFEQVMGAIWSAVCVPLLMQWQKRLADGEAINVGSLTIVAGGLLLRGSLGIRGFKRVFTPWSDIKCEVKNGEVTVSSSTSDAGNTLGMGVINSLLVPALIRAAQS